MTWLRKVVLFFVIGLLLSVVAEVALRRSGDGSLLKFLPKSLVQKIDRDIVDRVVEVAGSLIDKIEYQITDECDPTPGGRETIEIEGQILPYHPNHTYFVNGKIITTGKRLPSCSKVQGSWKDLVFGGEGSSEGIQLDTILDAYAPKNMQKMQETLEMIQENAKARKKAFDELAE